MLNIFDVDRTVIKKTSAWYFIREALAEKAVSISQVRRLPLEWLRYKMGVLSNDFIEEAVKHIAGLERKTAEVLAESCFKKRMKAGIYEKAERLIRDMRQRGETVIFATSSLSIIIHPLQHFLDINETLASALEFSQGKATGRIDGFSLYGEKKKTAVQQWLAEHQINPRDARFYSDSWTDIPLMEYCGEAVAVNPDHVLEREAKKRGWKIQRFHKTLG